MAAELTFSSLGGTLPETLEVSSEFYVVVVVVAVAVASDCYYI